MGGAYRVYVLQNPRGNFYVGLTNDVVGRLQHDEGDRSRRKSWSLARCLAKPKPFVKRSKKVRESAEASGTGKDFYTITGLGPSES